VRWRPCAKRDVPELLRYPRVRGRAAFKVCEAAVVPILPLTIIAHERSPGGRPASPQRPKAPYRGPTQRCAKLGASRRRVFARFRCESPPRRSTMVRGRSRRASLPVDLCKRARALETVASEVLWRFREPSRGRLPREDVESFKRTTRARSTVQRAQVVLLLYQGELGLATRSVDRA